MSDALLTAKQDVEIPIQKEHGVIAWFERWTKADCSKLDMIGRQGVLDAAKELAAVLGFGPTDELEREVPRLEDVVDDLEDKLSDAEDRERSLEDSLKEARGDLDNASMEIRELERNIKDLEENVNG